MIAFSKHSGIYTLRVMQKLPIGLADAWNFFSSPTNLEKITPKHMGFSITSGVPDDMYAGQLISYKVSPLPGIKTNWITEITHVERHKFFVDEQRFGPYSMWHHEHHFEELADGIMMVDKVSYKIPFGLFGHMAQALFVKKQLREIFEFRKMSLEEMFGKLT
ncbi:MAG: hypothetical protein AB8B73_14735 [Ekhidna sp.]